VFQKEIFLLFFLGQVSRGKETIVLKVNPIEEKKEFAEQCRMALEKSYGKQIPMPKCLGKNQ
jgi:hypothetical protein